MDIAFFLDEIFDREFDMFDGSLLGEFDVDGGSVGLVSSR